MHRSILTADAIEGPDFTQHRLHLADGRRVMCAEYGARARRPILYLHGFLGSRLEPRGAGQLEGNVIAVDRPGYGGSAPAGTRSLAAFGQDFVATLDRLGIERCGLVGVSAGGPYAIAAALAAGPRVERLVLAGAVAERGMIRLAGGAVRIFERFRRHRGLLRVVLPRLINQARNHGFDARFVRHVLSQELDRFAPEVDRALVAQSLLISLREGLRPGLHGLMQDVELLTAEWDVAPHAVAVPTLVLHGEADTIVPPMHARWYGQQIPGAHVEIHYGHGHVSLVVNRARQVIGFLQG